MRCRNPNLDDCMANVTKVIQKFFQMRTRMIQITGQTIKRLQKFTEKNDYPSESLCNACCADRQKVNVFFFKNEWSLNQFQ